MNLLTRYHYRISDILRQSFIIGSMLLMTACNHNLFNQEQQIKYAEGERNPYDEVDNHRNRESQILTLLDAAQQASYKNDLTSAQRYYQQVLEIDEHNPKAQEGLNRIERVSVHQTLLSNAEPLIGQSKEADTQALEWVSVVLTEDPNNDEASKLYRRIIASQEARRIENMKVKIAYDDLISLEFRDTELKVIVEALAKGTGINFSLDGDVKSNQKISIFVKNVPLQDALELLVQSNSLRMKVLTENSVLIYPDKTVKVREYQDLVIRSFYLEYADPAKVSAMLSAMLGMKNIQTNDRLPILVVKDVPEIMPLAERLILSQDLPEPEVMLELDIIEVQRSAGEDLGVRWPTQLSVLSTDNLTLEALKNTNSSTIGVSPNPALLFDGKDSSVNLLANPRIRVKNGNSAKIHIGDKVPIFTSNSNANGVISENVQYIDVGIKLEAEPTINLGGDVNIKLSLDVSNLGNEIRGNGGSVAFQIGTRNATTELRLKDGETQVLAGLINDVDRRSVGKIPGIGDLPVLGKLFSETSDEKTKTELILAITPRIVRQTPQPDRNLSKYWVGSELNTGRSSAQPRSQADISKLFKAGIAPGQVNKPSQNNAEPELPKSLNIPLPPGMASDL